MRHGKILVGLTALLILIGPGGVLADAPPMSTTAITPHKAAQACPAVTTRFHKAGAEGSLITRSSPGDRAAAQCIVNTSSDELGRGPELSAHSSLAEWLELIGKALWPFVAILLLCMVGSEGLRRLLTRIRHVKGGAIEFEFGAESARQFQAAFGSEYEEFRRVTDREYVRLSNVFNLNTILRNTAQVVREEFPNTDYRVTVHVPDVVFEEYLYQLLDYYPSGTGRGRRFSIRYGIIGRVWRTEESLGQGNALRPGYDDNATHLTQNGHTSHESKEENVYALMKYWGMTRGQAENWNQARPSFLCVLLKSDKDKDGKSPPVGILYFDSLKPDAFGNEKKATNLAIALEQNDAVIRLADAVAATMSKLREGGAYIEID